MGIVQTFVDNYGPCAFMLVYSMYLHYQVTVMKKNGNGKKMD